GIELVEGWARRFAHAITGQAAGLKQLVQQVPHAAGDAAGDMIDLAAQAGKRDARELPGGYFDGQVVAHGIEGAHGNLAYLAGEELFQLLFQSPDQEAV